MNELRPDTECALMERFEEALNAGLVPGGRPELLLPEFGDIQGRPDLVDAHIRPQVLPAGVSRDVLATTLKSPTNARLLAALRHRAPRNTSYLERVTGLTRHSLRRYLRQLESASLIEIHGGSTVSLTCKLPWDMVEIVAYEGKLKNWRRALHQALSYRSFSRSVWIVMPMSGAQRAKKLSTVFNANGIGLIGIGDDGGMRVEIKSKKHRHPTSRRLYLMAVGAVLNRVRKGEIKLPHQP